MNNEKEYIYYNAVSYSGFSRWLKSPDYALLPFSESEAMLLGKCFEDYLESIHTGKQFDWIYKDVTATTLISAMNNPVIKARANKHNEAVAYLQEGKIAPNDFKYKIERMTENIEKAVITSGRLQGIKASEILKGNYQVESYGSYVDGQGFETPIKAKFDIVNNGIYDIKTTSDISRFKWSYKDNYWIQDFIYSYRYGSPLVFLIVETVEPFVSKFAYRSGDFEAWQYMIIERNINDYFNWKQDKKPLGYINTELL